MTRDRVVVAVLAVLAVAALGLGASAIDAIDAGDAGSGDAGSGDRPTVRTAPADTGGGLGWLAPVAGVVVVLALLGAAVLVLDAMTPRVALICGLVFVTGLLIAILLPQVTTLPAGNATNGSAPQVSTPEGSPATPTPAVADGGAPTTPGAVLALFAAVAVLGGFAVYHFTRDSVAQTSDESPSDGEAAALGRAAGRAADRIDATDPENGVYRAWYEMTDVLDVATPETTTPAEFADLAIGAGLDADDVATLTDLFRDVRYGDVALTKKREQRARDTLRRIESEYAVDDSDGDSVTDPRNGGGAE